MIADGAILEAELAGGIALYDVAHLLPTNPRRRQQRRDPSKIVRQYHHHSGALGAAGYLGLLRSARYVVEERDFPGEAYTYWLAYVADRDPEGRLVVYRGQRDEVRSWHTGDAANAHGVAVCWQGNLTERKPSADQIEMAEALIPWLIARHEMELPDGISWHSEADRFGGRAKAACPGPHVEAWLESYREAA